MQLRWKGLVAASLVAAGLIGTPVHAAPGGEGYRHASGLQVLTGAVPGPPTPLPESVAKAWSDAYDLATKRPVDFGYPAVDRAAAGGPKVLIRVATTVGARAVAGKATEKAPVTFARLERVKDDAFDLKESSIPGADSIWMTEPDAINNRIIVSVERLSDELAAELVKRFGTDDLAVRVRPRIKATITTRDNDTSPFYGGSKIHTPGGGTCTTAFPWAIAPGVHGMLTAGHCVMNGGTVGTPAYDMGTVAAGTRENWNTAGTVKINGSAYYRGDMALIEVRSAYSVQPYVWRTNTGYTTVRSKWSRWAASGDQYCAAGYANGEICGYSVNATGINFDYWNMGEIRNAAQGHRLGNCAGAGDSGGPVYTIRSDGTAVPKGINSGSSFDGLCMHFFTDIWHAYEAFPGDVRYQ
ncbi:S1 family peptidase [Actinoplanes solisilvae]|uniref:S1 family peptidase n=1 Tax=Actinoplanes solisilvae TaxID=2486853 RepID=UPI000FD970C9|nr:S1 family peptidase [Actinoplanes solisilvae]